MTHDLCVGSKVLMKNLDVAEAVLSADKLQSFIGSNMDDISDIPYDQLYMLYETLGKIKWKLVEMIGKEAIQCTQ